MLPRNLPPMTDAESPWDAGKGAKDPPAQGSKMPARIYAQASPRSVGGVSLFEAQSQIHSATVGQFFSDGEVVDEAVAYLQEAGFDILQITPLTINIAGSAATYRKAFKTDIVIKDLPVIKEFGRKGVGQFLDSLETGLLGLIEPAGTNFERVIEGVALEEKRYMMAGPSMFAPLKSYWHLRVPGDISLGCNADRAHRTGITGKGVKVAMVDSGHFKHPFFVGRGYNLAPVVLGPGAFDSLKDESGHGTGESANIFANAPDATLHPVKMSFVNSLAAFNTAVGLDPDVITCSWGSNKQFGQLSAADQAMAAAIAAAVASGIVVVFSAGNGHWAFPGQHPDVISAGGVYMNPDESLQASNYASGFVSNIYPARRVPDLSGLVGLQPKAMYIMLPLEPGNTMDLGGASGTHPNADETTKNDGWAAFSGTSAAAPQLAGVAALIKQVCPGLKPAQVRDVMMKTARDVTAGKAHSNTGGTAAGVGPDTATGNGLVDAHKAIMLAKVRCVGSNIGGPVRPVRPVRPIQIFQSAPSVAPIINYGPLSPAPNDEGFTSDPATGGAGETLTGTTTGTQRQLSAEDVEVLTELIVNSDLDVS